MLVQFVIKCALIEDEQFSQNDIHFFPVFIWYILETVDQRKDAIHFIVI